MNEPNAGIAPVFAYNGQSRVNIPRDISRVEIHCNTKIIGTWALSGFRSLEQVDFPEGLQVIGRSAFSSSTSLQHIRLPSSVKEIRSGVFAHCSALRSIEMGEELQWIMDGAFQHCSSLVKAKIPPLVSNLGNILFYGCSSLLSVDLPEGIKVVGRSAFMRCDSLVRVTIPSTVTYIGAFAFKRCPSLVSVELPERIETIRDEAFTGCPSLKNVFIPPSINDLAEYIMDYDSLLLDQGFPDIEDLVIHEDAECTTPIITRFDGLPLHKLCYFQAHPALDKTDPLDACRRIMKEESSIMSDKKRQDYLGMTPLHILALSYKPNAALWEVLLEAFPRDLEMNDVWGNSPIGYLIDNGACGSVELLRHALKARSRALLNSLGLEKWKVEIVNTINGMADDSDCRQLEIELLDDKIAKYQRKEILSLLELAIWRAKMEEITNDIVVDPLERARCRINCRAETMISNIMPFLGKVEASA